MGSWSNIRSRRRIEKLLGCQFRDVFVLILFDQDADDLHERGERMRLIFAHLINEVIQ